eukprot:TRINITY_DN9143_c2_g2_i1.p1 TRINITY_DN9143_c2_g2~~TRINITY_DN9143_c2_g2_i1.p1  ORF type:complete len:518 (+),score=121.07 TRINITY_DN9143_c2_g2_i1:57-1556(+)
MDSNGISNVDMKEVMMASADDCDCIFDEDEEEDMGTGEDILEERLPGEEALQLAHQLDPGKFHVGVRWVHLAGLHGKRERFNGMKCLVTDYSAKDQSKVKVRSAEKNENGKFIALWVKRMNCRNTVHKDNGYWMRTDNPENTGATGAARWVALGRPEVENMKGKLKWKDTPEEEAERAQLFQLMDINGNGYVSLAELDKALPDLMGCVALFNAKPAIIRAFMAALERPCPENDDRCFREHAKDYIQPGEQFRVLMQYLHEYFEMYLIFQEMGDADADRRIDCQEWADFIVSGKAERVGIEVTEELLQDKCGETPMPGYSLFNEIDSDQGGCILFKEFSEYCIRKGIKDKKRSMEQASRPCPPARGGSTSSVDVSKLRPLFEDAKDLPNGISLERFRKIVQKVGGLAPEEVEQIIVETDENHNGVIDVEEFLEWLQGLSMSQDELASKMKVSEASRLKCKNGCGMLAAKGFTRRGNPMDTCCRGCALGGDHDRSCAREPA